MTARRSRLEERGEDGSRRARTALRMMDEPVRFISTVQVGITLFGIALGAVGEPLVSQWFEWLPRGAAFVIAFGVLTYLSVVIGELVPKAVALQRAERIALAARPPRRCSLASSIPSSGSSRLGERGPPAASASSRRRPG